MINNKKIIIFTPLIILLIIILVFFITQKKEEVVIDQEEIINQEEIIVNHEGLVTDNFKGKIFENKEELLCYAIVRNDVSLCDELPTYFFDIEEKELDNCKVDVILNNFLNYQCDTIQNQVLKMLCQAKDEKNPSLCNGENFIGCKAIVDKDLDVCNDYPTEVGKKECQNIYYAIYAKTSNDCEQQILISDAGEPINWKNICQAKINRDISFC